MKIKKALNVLSISLQGYIQDCAGEGSSEAKEIDKAWHTITDKLKEPEVDFPNGFDSWLETHFEMVDAITNLRNNNHPLAVEIDNTGGTGEFYDLAKTWAFEFEKKHKGRNWDGEFYDEIESFVDSKLETFSST